MYGRLVQYSAVHCSTVQYSTVQYSTVRCTIQYSAVQRNTVQYSAVQYSTVQCSKVSWPLLQLPGHYLANSSCYEAPQTGWGSQDPLNCFWHSRPSRVPSTFCVAIRAPKTVCGKFSKCYIRVAELQKREPQIQFVTISGSMRAC